MEWNTVTLTALLVTGQSIVTRVRERGQGDLPFARPLDLAGTSAADLANLLVGLEALECAGLVSRIEMPDPNDPTEYEVRWFPKVDG